MKKLLFLFAVLFSISTVGQDMQNYLSETKKMVKQQRFEEANERFIWFQNHVLAFNPGMKGVRLSFALTYWKSLADIYPPALVSMTSMRDQKNRQLLDSNGSTNLFADIAALNKTLSENYQTVDVFEQLEKTDHEKAKRCWHYAKGVLFSAKRYDIIRNYLGNPVHEFNLIKNQREWALGTLKKSDQHANTLQDFTDNHFVEKTLELIKFSIAVDDPISAKKIKMEALKLVKDNRLRDIKLTKEKGV